MESDDNILTLARSGPEGKFGHVLDLKRLADNLDYIERGKSHRSESYRLVNDGEMPPDDHPKTPPLTIEEKEVVLRWIQAGAPDELPAELPKRTLTTPTPPPAKTQTTARVTLDLRDRPAAEVFAEITKQTGLRIDYTAPPKEPRLSITLKNGTALEALDYLVLCGNLALSWEGETANVKPVLASAGK